MSAGTVLITRPLHDAVPVAEAVEQKGLRPLIEPMMEIVPLDITLPPLKEYQGLVFTSANGIRAFCALSDARDLPIYIVGRDSARVAIESGFTRLVCGQGSMDSLLPLIDADEVQQDGRPLLHLAGEHIARAAELPNITVERLTLYRAEAVPALSRGVLEKMAAGEVSHIMFFSPRTARIFTELLAEQGGQRYLLSIKALCISDSVLKCVRTLPWQDILVADRPARRAMLALL